MRPSGLLRLIRPVNCLMMGLAVVVGAVVTAGADVADSPLGLALGFAAGFSVAGSAMAINDYFDREVDAINEPGRPIPSGAVSSSEALAAFIVLSAAGLLAAALTSPSSLALALLAWAAAVLYSREGKATGLAGNLLVSACVALPFVYGGLAVGNAVPASSLLFSAMAFLSNAGREVTKGIVDVEGDRAKGIRTVAVSSGERTAAAAAAAFYLSAVAVSLLPLPMAVVSAWYAPVVSVADLGLIHSSYSLLRDPRRENGRRVKGRVLIWMLIGLLGFLAGRIR